MNAPPGPPAPIGPRLEPYRPSESATVSGFAVASLVLGICSFAMCMGPLASLPAIALGFLAQREISRSEGRVGGATMGVLGAAIGMVNLLSIAGGIAYFVYDNAHTTTTSTPPAPPFPVIPTAPTVSPTSPSPSPTSPKTPRARGGEITTLPQVVETKVGNITLVDVPATTRGFKDELKAQQKKARSSQETLMVFTTFDQCRPCMSASAVMLDPKMQTALENVRLVRVDTNELKEDLEELNIPTAEAPGFFLIGPDLRAFDGVTGGEWDDDVPENIAPVLGPFSHGKLKRRKMPFKGSPGGKQAPHDPSPPGGSGTAGKGSYL